MNLYPASKVASTSRPCSFKPSSVSSISHSARFMKVNGGSVTFGSYRWIRHFTLVVMGIILLVVDGCQADISLAMISNLLFISFRVLVRKVLAPQTAIQSLLLKYFQIRQTPLAYPTYSFRNLDFSIRVMTMSLLLFSSCQC